MYFGMVDALGKELTERGYRREYLGDHLFKLTPSPREGEHCTFVNVAEIVIGLAQEDWPPAKIAMFAEADSSIPLFCFQFDGFDFIKIRRGQIVELAPGGINIEPRMPVLLPTRRLRFH